MGSIIKALLLGTQSPWGLVIGKQLEGKNETGLNHVIMNVACVVHKVS